jgi:hypothetical protein
VGGARSLTSPEKESLCWRRTLIVTNYFLIPLTGPERKSEYFHKSAHTSTHPVGAPSLEKENSPMKGFVVIALATVLGGLMVDSFKWVYHKIFG